MCFTKAKPTPNKSRVCLVGLQRGCPLEAADIRKDDQFASLSWTAKKIATNHWKKNDRKLRTDLSWENDNQQGSTFEWLFVIP